MDKIYDLIDHTFVFTFANKKVEVDLQYLIWPLSSFAVFYLLFLRKTGFKDLGDQAKLRKQSKDEANPDDKPYENVPVNIPEISGKLSGIYRRFFRSTIGRLICVDTAKKLGKMDLFLKLNIPDPPTFYPIVHPNQEDCSWVEQDFQLEDYIKPSSGDKFHFNTISDYYTAYKDHTVTPLQVARRLIVAIRESEKQQPPMRILTEFHEDEILKSAEESTSRWKENKPLSVFDGILVAVKEELSLSGHSCRFGTPVKDFDKKCMDSDEGIMVSRLRSGGAIFIGMANMHQFGVGITTINPSPLHGTTRNPYNINYPPGGSSGGSAAAVAAGLCPIGLGLDGGGSIRIPASVCGVVGVKTSYARIGLSDMHDDGISTIGHAGFLAGIDPETPVGHQQPKVDLDHFDRTDLNGLRIGIDWGYFNDCDPEIARSCKKAVEFLSNERNANIVDISIPEIQESQRAHAVTILAEIYALCKSVYHKNHDELNMEVEVNLALGESITAAEYFLAQRQRTRTMNILKRLFKDVDCIITPVTGAFMPKITDEMLRYGFTDLNHILKVTRFCNLGNFAGHPSISVPVGYAKESGLPIGLMIQTAWWKESLMLRIANSLDNYCARRKPEVFYNLLEDKS